MSSGGDAVALLIHERDRWLRDVQRQAFERMRAALDAGGDAAFKAALDELIAAFEDYAGAGRHDAVPICGRVRAAP